MPIPVRRRTLDFVKVLTEVQFRRNLETNEFEATARYAEGYYEEDRFVVTGSTEQNHTGDSAAFLLGLRGSQGTVEDPSLAEMLTQIFDAVETGALRPPPATPPAPAQPDPLEEA